VILVPPGFKAILVVLSGGPLVGIILRLGVLAPPRSSAGDGGTEVKRRREGAAGGPRRAGGDTQRLSIRRREVYPAGLGAPSLDLRVRWGASAWRALLAIYGTPSLPSFASVSSFLCLLLLFPHFVENPVVFQALCSWFTARRGFES